MSEQEHTGQGTEKDIPPWLQPVPEEEDAVGFFQGKRTLILTAVAALVVVVLFVLALLYLYGGANDGPPRHVAADTTPVREKPQDAGGMEVPHQDKQVFDQGMDAASESVQLAEQPEQPLAELPPEPEVEAEAPVLPQATPRPVVKEPVQANGDGQAREQTSEPEAEGTTPPRAVPEGSYKVQLGAYGSEEAAARAWRGIRVKHGTLLEGLSPLYEAVQSGDRTLYRLRLGPVENRAAADEVCLGLRAQQQACIVVNP